MGELWVASREDNNMRSLPILFLAFGVGQPQLKFGGSSSSSSSNSPSSSSGSQPSTDTRFISTGNELIDGGLLGGAVLGGALNGGNNNPCGRRRRQAEEGDTNTRLFGLFGGNNGCNCGYNQYPQNNYPSNNYPSNNYPSNNYPSNSGQNSCQCNYQLTFQDKYGNTHGACRRPDETGRTWCYTTGGWGCSDARQSQRFPNNPWSYQACSFSG